MKYYILITILLLGIMSLTAEEWNISTDMSFTLNQSAYSDNWSGDEVSNITWVFTSHTKANKKLSDLLFWRNNLRLAFGQTHRQETNLLGNKYWVKPIKSTDKIDFDSMLRATLNQFVDPFVAFRWESQFLDSYDNETLMINPMRFTESAGIAKDIINVENQYLTARIGAAFRQNLDRSELAKLLDQEMTTDGGIEFVSEYNKRFPTHGLNLNSRLLLYQALFYSEEDNIDNDNWKALDIAWENSVTTKIWSLVNLVFDFDLIYEKEEDLKGQFRQHLGLGIIWQL